MLLLIRFCRLSSTDYEFGRFSPVSVQQLIVIVDCCLKLKNSVTKWQSPPQNSREKSSFLRKLTDSWLSSAYLIILFPVVSSHLFISVSHAQLHSSTWFHCGLPRISSFTLSRYPFYPRHNSRWRSLFMRMRSRSDTHHLSGVYGNGAGATKSWPKVVSLSRSCRNFLCIRSNFDSCGWSTRIIDFSSLIFNSVHQSYCQKPLISISTWRQAHTQSRISCCHSTKRVAFIAIDSAPKSTDQRNRKRSLFRKDRRMIFLIIENTEGMSQWPWQASISFGKLIQSSYSESNSIYYFLPSRFQDTMRVASSKSIPAIPRLNANEKRTYSNAS